MAQCSPVGLHCLQVVWQHQLVTATMPLKGLEPGAENSLLQEKLTAAPRPRCDGRSGAGPASLWRSGASRSNVPSITDISTASSKLGLHGGAFQAASGLSAARAHAPESCHFRG